MALSILNNIPALAAQNQLTITGAALSRTLFRLASGTRINSGADDAAGLAIADGLRASITALSQSSRNANDGIGSLSVADGALAQISNLLNRAITLGTEAATGTVSDDQRGALDTEFQAILAEIDRIGSSTTFNGTSVFTTTATSIFLSDASTNTEIASSTQAVSSANLTSDGSSTINLSDDLLTSVASATTAISEVNDAIEEVALLRGEIGATINRLHSAVTVIANQVLNLTAAEDGFRAADIAVEIANLTKFQILNQTGLAALSQANAQQQNVLTLLR